VTEENRYNEIIKWTSSRGDIKHRVALVNYSFDNLGGPRERIDNTNPYVRLMAELLNKA